MNQLAKIAAKNIALIDKVETTKYFIQKSKAENTRRAYKSDVQNFTHWCKANHLDRLPPEPSTIALYISDLAEQGKKCSTIKRRLSAIKMFYKAQGHDSPTSDQLVKSTMEGIQRANGVALIQKKPLLIDDMQKMIAILPDSLIGVRDKALLLLGFAGAFRRSELVSLDVEDLEFNKGGIVIVIRRSKTDQKGRGIKKGIPYGSNLLTCPVRALTDWFDMTGIESGAVFRSVKKGGVLKEGRLSDRDVARIVKRIVLKVGLNPDDFAGHSLRSGFATQAAINNARFDKIMDQGGWKSEMTVKRYIRDGNLFRDNAASKLGL